MKPRRAVLPLAVFLAVLSLHCGWALAFPEVPPEQGRWIAVSPPTAADAFRRYLASQGYWLGVSFALSSAFAAAAFRRYREERHCGGGSFAVGGVTVSGVLAAAGCFLVGCCGSPMLGVYATLLGASVAPLMKPLIAALTALTIIGAWAWMNRRSRLRSAAGPDERDAPCC